MEYLTFQKLITPIIIQILFWIAVVVVIIGGIAAIAQGSAGRGILLIILGPIAARVYAELLIVIFNIERDVRRMALGPAAPSSGMPSSYPPSPTPSA
ncbi:MAG TPA: DUF4282 domain-containing protein [Candidatus Dormibacteraeota bacterium]|nr:DUF4282 domain-containing protein [Candidatus Dormibacteraeota bacterium]